MKRTIFMGVALSTVLLFGTTASATDESSSSSSTENSQVKDWVEPIHINRLDIFRSDTGESINSSIVKYKKGQDIAISFKAYYSGGKITQYKDNHVLSVHSDSPNITIDHGHASPVKSGEAIMTGTDTIHISPTADGTFEVQFTITGDGISDVQTQTITFVLDTSESSSTSDSSTNTTTTTETSSSESSSSSTSESSSSDSSSSTSSTSSSSTHSTDTSTSSSSQSNSTTTTESSGSSSSDNTTATSSSGSSATTSESDSSKQGTGSSSSESSNTSTITVPSTGSSSSGTHMGSSTDHSSEKLPKSHDSLPQLSIDGTGTSYTPELKQLMTENQQITEKQAAESANRQLPKTGDAPSSFLSLLGAGLFSSAIGLLFFRWNNRR